MTAFEISPLGANLERLASGALNGRCTLCNLLSVSCFSPRPIGIATSKTFSCEQKDAAPLFHCIFPIEMLKGLRGREQSRFESIILTPRGPYAAECSYTFQGMYLF